MESLYVLYIWYGILLFVFITQGPKIPSYAQETMTSRQHTREDLFMSREVPKTEDIERSSDLGGSVISEEPLDQGRKKDEEVLVTILWVKGAVILGFS